MNPLIVLSVPVLSDNYVYMIHDGASGETAVVDPATAGPVLKVAKGRGWHIDHIFLTHHHSDHTGGVEEIRRAGDCRVYGASTDAKRLPVLDVPLKDGDPLPLGGKVMAVPGHTKGHVAFWFAEAKALFSGDCLFSMGCGRIFDGTPEQFWASLKSLRALPDETRVYSGHEYTLDNLAFALSLDPDNPVLQRRQREASAQREAGQSTLPSRLGDEKVGNPFLRADDAALQERLGMAGADPVRVFAEIRSRKDIF